MEWESVSNDFIDCPPAYKNCEAIITPWIGIWHNPPGMLKCYDKGLLGISDIAHAPQNILERDIFQQSLATCCGIMVFSEYMAKWVRKVLPKITVSVFFHPTEPAALWKYRKFLQSPKYIQIGYWLRDITALARLPIVNNWRRIWLYGSEYALTQSYILEKKFNICIRDHAEIMIVNNHDYDKMLESCVAFLYLIDSSCNNAVIECVKRRTPLIVNRHPAVVEYLGENYPLYYDNLEEAAAFTIDEIYACHQYMIKGKCPCDKYIDLDVDNFVKKVIETYSHLDIGVSVSVHECPCDFVITWVDSSDSSWQLAHEYTSSVIGIDDLSTDEFASDANSTARYRSSHEELSLCIEMIHKSAPFRNKIYIVVSKFNKDSAEQVKKNINISNIYVVTHDEIGIEHSTFNSCYIEAHLNLIPGLSEHFVYLNDDMLMLGKWKFSDLFSDGTATGFIADKLPSDNSSFAQMWKTTSSVLKKEFNIDAHYTMSHGPYPLTKSLWDITPKIPLILNKINKYFRSSVDILPICGLLHYIAAANNKAVMLSNKFQCYFDIAQVTKESFGILCLQDDDTLGHVNMRSIREQLIEKGF